MTVLYLSCSQSAMYQKIRLLTIFKNFGGKFFRVLVVENQWGVFLWRMLQKFYFTALFDFQFFALKKLYCQTKPERKDVFWEFFVTVLYVLKLFRVCDVPEH